MRNRRQAAVNRLRQTQLAGGNRRAAGRGVGGQGGGKKVRLGQGRTAQAMAGRVESGQNFLKKMLSLIVFLFLKFKF
jgi:hypothetical protein